MYFKSEILLILIDSLGEDSEGMTVHEKLDKLLSKTTSEITVISTSNSFATEEGGLYLFAVHKLSANGLNSTSIITGISGGTLIENTSVNQDVDVWQSKMSIGIIKATSANVTVNCSSYSHILVYRIN